MTLSIILGITVFLGGSILSQKLGLNARARLDDATKLKISDIFAERNVNYSIFVYMIFIAYLAGQYAFPQYYAFMLIAYVIVFSIFILVKLFLNLKKLKEIAAPADYIRSVIFSFVVFIGGAVAAVIVIVVGNSWHTY